MGLRSGLEETTKKLIISEIFWLGLGVKQIIDSFFLFLLADIGLNFNENVLK